MPGPDCSLHKFFISWNLILCVLVTVLSVHPRIQESQPRSGLLQASVITLYTMYLTWSAMTNSPNPECKPHWPSQNATAPATEAPGLLDEAKEFLGVTTPAPPVHVSHMDTESIISLVIWMLCVLYSSMKTASSSAKLTGSDKVLLKVSSHLLGMNE